MLAESDALPLIQRRTISPLEQVDRLLIRAPDTASRDFDDGADRGNYAEYSTPGASSGSSGPARGPRAVAAAGPEAPIRRHSLSSIVPGDSAGRHGLARSSSTRGPKPSFWEAVQDVARQLTKPSNPKPLTRTGSGGVTPAGTGAGAGVQMTSLSSASEGEAGFAHLRTHIAPGGGGGGGPPPPRVRFASL